MAPERTEESTGEENLWWELRPIAQNATINRGRTAAATAGAAAVVIIIIIIAITIIIWRVPFAWRQLARVSMIRRRHFWRCELRTLYIIHNDTKKAIMCSTMSSPHTKSGNWKIDKNRRCCDNRRCVVIFPVVPFKVYAEEIMCRLPVLVRIQLALSSVRTALLLLLFCARSWIATFYA